MIQNERDIRHEQVLQGVRQMMTAARTAPKAKGIDIIEMALVADAELIQIADQLESMGRESGKASFLRDADNLRHAEAVMIIGTCQQTMGMNCAYCGFLTCSSKPKDTPCALNSIDLGIAIGSACATAADLRLDTRVMFSAGLAAQRIGWLGKCKSLMAIPVSASSKNMFFDRSTFPSK